MITKNSKESVSAAEDSVGSRYERRILEIRKQAELIYRPSTSRQVPKDHICENVKDNILKMCGPIIESRRVLFIWGLLLIILNLKIMEELNTSVLRICFSICKWMIIIIEVCYLIQQFVKKMKFKWLQLKAWLEEPIEITDNSGKEKLFYESTGKVHTKRRQSNKKRDA